MLHAPVSDPKRQADGNPLHSTAVAQRELDSWERSALRSSASLSPQVQRQMQFSRLQNAYGNQAVLRMLGQERSAAASSAGGMLQRKCSCGKNAGDSGMCTEYQRKQASPKASETAAPPIVQDVLRSAGQPLDTETRTFMEPRFGQDFSQVRVHTDTKAAQSAQAIDAQAYTLGQHIVFGAGSYAPTQSGGQQLLAHELVHVVQQSHTTKSVPISQKHLTISQPFDRDEIEADTIANRIMTGNLAPPLSIGQPARLYRSVRERVVPEPLSNPQQARACMVHLHGNEQNAFQVASELRRTHCANFVHLNSSPSDRTIHVEVPARRAGRRRLPAITCEADPNRIFTPTGITSTLVGNGCADVVAAQTELAPFVDELKREIRACRLGSGSGLAGSLPVVAFHNNALGDARRTPRPGLSIRSYLLADPLRGNQPGSEAGATETDPTRLGTTAAGVTNPNPMISPAESEDDWLVTTNPNDFRALSGGLPGVTGASGRRYNVVLQSTSPTDDGSLSVAIAQEAASMPRTTPAEIAAASRTERYINIESGGKRFRPPRRDASGNLVHRPQFVNNREMALDVFALLGVPQQPCTPPTPSSLTSSASAPEPEAIQRSSISHIQRQPITSATLQRNPNATLDRFMRDVYNRQVNLWIAQGATYQGAIAAGDRVALPSSDVLPGRRVEVHRDIEAVLQSLLSDARSALRADRTAGIPAAQNVTDIRIRSGYRSAQEQLGIWERNYPRYYRETRAHRRTLPGGEHGPAAAQYLAEYINQRVHSPGYSQHQRGRTVDFTYKENGVWAEADTTPAGITSWEHSWLFQWLLANAASYDFRQNPSINEPWHWEYHPRGGLLLRLLQWLLDLLQRLLQELRHLFLREEEEAPPSEPPSNELPSPPTPARTE